MASAVDRRLGSAALLLFGVVLALWAVFGGSRAPRTERASPRVTEEVVRAEAFRDPAMALDAVGEGAADGTRTDGRVPARLVLDEALLSTYEVQVRCRDESEAWREAQVWTGTLRDVPSGFAEGRPLEAEFLTARLGPPLSVDERGAVSLSRASERPVLIARSGDYQAIGGPPVRPESTVVLWLERDAWLQVALKDEFGAPVEGASIQLVGFGSAKGMGKSATTRPNGLAAVVRVEDFRGLFAQIPPPGEWTHFAFQLNAPTIEPVRLMIREVPEEAHIFELTCPPVGTLEIVPSPSLPMNEGLSIALRDEEGIRDWEFSGANALLEGGVARFPLVRVGWHGVAVVFQAGYERAEVPVEGPRVSREVRRLAIDFGWTARR